MLQFIGANIIHGLIKMSKLMKSKDYLLVALSLAHQTLVHCISMSPLFMVMLTD
jgi:hypothetical protein